MFKNLLESIKKVATWVYAKVRELITGEKLDVQTPEEVVKAKVKVRMAVRNALWFVVKASAYVVAWIYLTPVMIVLHAALLLVAIAEFTFA